MSRLEPGRMLCSVRGCDHSAFLPPAGSTAGVLRLDENGGAPRLVAVCRCHDPRTARAHGVSRFYCYDGERRS